MAGKPTKSKKQINPGANRETKRLRILQIMFVVFCIILILSMVLSSIST